MLVKLIGGPAHGKVMENRYGDVIRFAKNPLLPTLSKPTEPNSEPIRFERVEYKIYSFRGKEKTFYIGCEGDIDEALERLFYD